MAKLKVGILGATGTVGQRMIQLLEGHPWFEVSAVAASDNSAGKNYAQATRWMLETPIPPSCRTNDGADLPTGARLQFCVVRPALGNCRRYRTATRKGRIAGVKQCVKPSDESRRPAARA